MTDDANDTSRLRQTIAGIEREAVENLSATAGGEDRERRLPLLSNESILAAFRRGFAQYEAILGQRVNVFGRRSYGLSCMLPQILDKLAFRAACHATMDAGRFPEGSQIKTRWEGVDGSAVDALAK